MAPLKFKPLILFLLVVFLLALSPLAIKRTKAASDGSLIQNGSGPIYLVEGSLKRQIKDSNTLANMCWSAIKQVSSAEINSHPIGPNFTRVIHYGGHVYFLDGCSKRHVLSFQALESNGFSSADLRDINTNTFEHWGFGSDLTAPKLMRSPGSTTVYFIDSGVRRAIKDGSSYGHWGFSNNTVAVNQSVLSYPQAQDLSRLVSFNGNVYGVDAGTFRWIGSDLEMRLNGYDPKDIVAINSDAANYMPIGAPLGTPQGVLDLSTGKRYLNDQGTLVEFISEYAYSQWGYTKETFRGISKINGLNISSYRLNVLARDAGGTYWYGQYGSKRLIPDTTTFNDYGFSDSDAAAVTHQFLNSIPTGSDLSRGVNTLDGIWIPSTSGKTGQEQHLYLGSDEADLGRTDASASLHYSRSGGPQAAQNGMAGGYGAFASSASPSSVDQERYYINMRWGYVQWYEDCEARDSGNHCATRTRNLDSSLKNWHRHKRVIVKNPANGHRIVASIEEAGPAIWTDRVSGLSPEAMLELGASTDTNLEYGWAVNQNLPLGRLY